MKLNKSLIAIFGFCGVLATSAAIAQVQPTNPGQTGGSLPGQTGGSLPGQTGGSMPGQTGGSIPGQTGGSMPGQTGGSMPGQTGTGSQVGAMDSAGMGGGKMGSGTGSMSSDSTFALKAASGGLTEVALGKMATEKGSSQSVKDYGQKMVDDHTKANDELKTLASSKNMTLPTSPNAKDQATIDKMSKLSGEAFDKAYVKDMVADHKMDITLFQKEATSGTDPDLKAFASKTLPTLQEHQTMINDIASKKM